MGMDVLVALVVIEWDATAETTREDGRTRAEGLAEPSADSDSDSSSSSSSSSLEKTPTLLSSRIVRRSGTEDIESWDPTLWHLICPVHFRSARLSKGRSVKRYCHIVPWCRMLLQGDCNFRMALAFELGQAN